MQGIHFSPILWAPLQLKALAAFSASALVLKRAGVAPLCGSLAQLNNTDEAGTRIIVKSRLSLCKVKDRLIHNN
ncbi:Hypothetical protein P9211_03711 [Prochlorococcus marinus str. MIT 9211]|uniref:Uncharacterized protein n=1 Tax=Prochlorococcus marinus (strain MIT 9211) TaxID=93059 RepID=A9BDZ2_PROM4|nr:Hypothetical protein P9211_03711 [Prochlorococcus marinus str. MIT 9211]